MFVRDLFGMPLYPDHEGRALCLDRLYYTIPAYCRRLQPGADIAYGLMMA